MNNIAVRNIARFVLLVLVQVLVLNNMNLGGYLNPYVYVLFILLLPARINKSFMLVLAFFTGLTIDYFGNTLGLHAAATVLLAFFRPAVLDLFFKNIEFSSGEEPGLSKIGVGGFLRYTLVLVFIHHSAIFFLEVFSFSDFLTLLYRIALSTLLSTAIIMITVMLFSKK